MARLPQPGGDSGQWGDVLNDYLSVTLKADGTLQPNVVTGIALQNNSVSTEKLATTAPPVSGQTLTYNGSQLAWATPSGGSTVSDATASAKGIIQLTGDLSGTATSPTVPGLSLKENAVSAGTIGQYYRGDKTWQTLDKSTVGLANVDNTTDANKPISSATQTALDSKAALSHVHSGADITSGTISSARLPLASSSVTGVVQLATNSETVTGTDTAKAVTSAGVKAAISAVTYPVIFVNTLGDIPPGTPVDTLVVVRAA